MLLKMQRSPDRRYLLQGQALRVLPKISTLTGSIFTKILAAGSLSDLAVHNKIMKRKSSIYKQSCQPISGRVTFTISYSIFTLSDSLVTLSDRIFTLSDSNMQ